MLAFKSYVVHYRVDLVAGVEFWTFIGLNDWGSTYMLVYTVVLLSPHIVFVDTLSNVPVAIVSLCLATVHLQFCLLHHCPLNYICYVLQRNFRT